MPHSLQPSPSPFVAPGRVRAGLLAIPVLALSAACQDRDPAAEAVAESIQVHGGERFENMDVSFTFRDDRFRVIRDGGLFRYERTYRDEEGREIRETLDNEGTSLEVDGREVPLGTRERLRVESDVNSVVYFAFLPFRLQEPSVRLRDLGEARVGGEPYRVVEVTFDEEGGGRDWQDRFIYWFHRDEATLDYLAHSYARGGGVTRFRRAVNRREVGGLLIQDYENYTAEDEIADLLEYPRLLEEGGLRLVSMVELEEVDVR